MKVSNLSILTKLLVITSPYHSLGEEIPKSAYNETGPHKGCLLMLKDKESPHKPMVGKEYEDKTTTNYMVENEAGSMAAQCVNGFAAGYPCNNVNLLSMLPISDLDDAVGTSSSANDIWGWTDTSTGREFALIGLYKGTAFVEITDPVNPVYLGGLPTQGSGSDWRDIKTFGNFAYIVSEESNHGMQVFDLTELLDASAGTVFSNTARYTQIGSAHNIFINEDTGFAYIVGASSCSGGLHMVDIDDEANPQFAGCYSNDGYTHDVQCVIYNGPDSTYTSNEICFASNEDTITIVDVTDKSNPILLSKESYENDGYTHQGWLTEDHSNFIFNDELDELSGTVDKTATHVMNVSDLDDIEYVGKYMGRTNAIDHNNYVMGEYLYQANYRAGFNILKINDAANIEFEEAGFFDIYPGSDSNQFNGAWSNYPYFPSGTIIVSGIEQGLFMLEFIGFAPTVSPRPTAAPVTSSPTISQAPTAAPTSCNGDEVTVELTTDDWASETSWDVTDDDGDVVMANGQLQNVETYITTKCLNYGCYVFTIRDTFGDGICCGYGDGFFTVKQGGTVIFSGGNFDSSDSELFCVEGTNAPSTSTVTPTVTVIATPEPSALPCYDARLPLSHNGNTYSCAQLSSGGGCVYDVVQSHCPLSCNACLEYKCKNSEAPFDTPNGVKLCIDLQDIPDEYCDFPQLFTTCRLTCEICDA